MNKKPNTANGLFKDSFKRRLPVCVRLVAKELVAVCNASGSVKDTLLPHWWLSYIKEGQLNPPIV